MPTYDGPDWIGHPARMPDFEPDPGADDEEAPPWEAPPNAHDGDPCGEPEEPDENENHAESPSLGERSVQRGRGRHLFGAESPQRVAPLGLKAGLDRTGRLQP
jgi:hypothetical protein